MKNIVIHLGEALRYLRHGITSSPIPQISAFCAHSFAAKSKTSLIYEMSKRSGDTKVVNIIAPNEGKAIMVILIRGIHIALEKSILDHKGLDQAQE
jgi:hypothetical protein